MATTVGTLLLVFFLRSSRYQVRLLRALGIANAVRWRCSLMPDRATLCHGLIVTVHGILGVVASRLESLMLTRSAAAAFLWIAMPVSSLSPGLS